MDGIARLLTLLVALAALLTADGLVPTLTPAQREEAREAIASFKINARGPFYRIRWFCSDGSEHPPAGTPCEALGGGRQHASLGPVAKKLQGWNIHVGTILASLNYEELLDAPLDHFWLKELVLHKYLAEIDDGWIYRRAASYRGAWQIQDEEQAGRR